MDQRADVFGSRRSLLPLRADGRDRPDRAKQARALVDLLEMALAPPSPNLDDASSRREDGLVPSQFVRARAAVARAQELSESSRALAGQAAQLLRRIQRHPAVSPTGPHLSDLHELSADITRLLDECDELDLSPAFRAFLFALDEALIAVWPSATPDSPSD